MGTSGQKISFQYSRVPLKVVIRKVIKASTRVTAMFPVRLAPPGKITISPSRFIVRMKKNTVSR